MARACARSSLIYILVVSTSMQTWYFCLPVGMAVVLGWRATFTRVTIAYSLLALPALYLNYYLRESTPLWVDLVYGLGPLVLLAHALPGRHYAQVPGPMNQPPRLSAMMDSVPGGTALPAQS